MNPPKLVAGKFPTNVLHRKTFEDLIFAETSYQHGQLVEKHSHNQSGFVIVLKGGFTETHEKGTRLCKSADVIFRPAGHLHANLFETAEARCLNLQFGSAWLSKLQAINDSNVSADPDYFSGGLLFAIGLKLYSEFRMPDLDSRIIMEGLTLEMLGIAHRLRPGKWEMHEPFWLKRVRDRIHSTFQERLSVQELAIEAGVHPVYLNRIFRKLYGQSIGEYLRTLRMEFCQQQLSATDLPIAEISTAAGFYDQSHLSRTFKRAYRMSPLAYRKFHRKV